MKGRGIIFAAMLAACASAAPAQAALIHMDGVTPTFTADPGERNDLWVSQSTAPPVNVFNDTGAPMRAELPCFAFIQGPERYCPLTLLTTPAIALGDQDDKLRSTGPVAADGGDGNDSIQTLMGSAVGGAGNDSLVRFPPAAYASSYPLDFDGGPGADGLYGGYDDDTLTGGPGLDSLNGGDGGADTLYAQDGEKDNVFCGYGWEIDIAYVDAIDVVSECEEVHLP